MTQEGDVLLLEKYGSLGYTAEYKKNESSLVRCENSYSIAHSILVRCGNTFRDIFLPYGYPDSVSEDYFSYQLWDTMQAFCSTVTGTFTTQAILKGVGVGDAKATPLAAAITWVLKDGSGMIGRIGFAWWKGTSLDADCKKWRLFADILNDLAMCVELVVPYYSHYSLQMLCATTSMKAIVGVAGGATRASITNHQAKRGNMGDVSAKDGSQETCVNLVASFVGILLLSLCTQPTYEWLVFITFICIHILSNYMAVKSLVFKNLNKARFNLLLQSYLKTETVPTSFSINQQESVLLGIGFTAEELCGFDIKLGCSLKTILKSFSASELAAIIDKYKNRRYLIVPDIKNRLLYIPLKMDVTTMDILTAYLNATLLAIVICNYNSFPLQIFSKRHLHKNTPIVRLQGLLKNIERNETGFQNLSSQYLDDFRDGFAQESNWFFTAIKLNNWQTDTHCLEVGEWRCDWSTKDCLEKKLA